MVRNKKKMHFYCSLRNLWLNPLFWYNQNRPHLSVISIFIFFPIPWEELKLWENLGIFTLDCDFVILYFTIIKLFTSLSLIPHSMMEFPFNSTILDDENDLSFKRIENWVDTKKERCGDEEDIVFIPISVKLLFCWKKEATEITKETKSFLDLSLSSFLDLHGSQFKSASSVCSSIVSTLSWDSLRENLSPPRIEWNEV